MELRITWLKVQKYPNPSNTQELTMKFITKLPKRSSTLAIFLGCFLLIVIAKSLARHQS